LKNKNWLEKDRSFFYSALPLIFVIFSNRYDPAAVLEEIKVVCVYNVLDFILFLGISGYLRV
jgi:hypothetical protein